MTTDAPPAITYKITFCANLGKALPEVGELVQQLNACVSSAGYDKKLTLTSTALIPSMLLTVKRELDEGEQNTVRNIILGQICRAFPKWDVEVAEFRRQSGNVQQSAS